MARITLPTRLSSHRGTSSSKDEGQPSSRSTSPAPKGSIPHATNGNLMLRVQVVKAKDLAPKDKGNTSDPYLVLYLGDARDSTVSIPKNLNPEWNETIELPIIGLQSMLLEVICWDKDRFGKDYMGEFDISLEDLFTSGYVATESKWYKLQSRKQGKKKSFVTGEVLLSFSLYDPLHTSATPLQLQQRLLSLAASSTLEIDHDDTELERLDSADSELDPDEAADSEEEEEEEGASSVIDDEKKTETPEKRKRRMKLKRLKKMAKQHAYEFSGQSDLAGVLFLEINKATDLPPERNVTRTSFDMDPFVVTSLGKKTYKTKVVRHNLNPVYDEKLVFQVMRHEQKYSLQFSMVDRDTLSGNDFIGAATFPVEYVAQLAPQTDPDTGLYAMSEPAFSSPPMSDSKKSRFRLPLSRTSSSTGIPKLNSRQSQSTITTQASSVASSSTALTSNAKSSGSSSSMNLAPVPSSPPPLVHSDSHIKTVSSQDSSTELEAGTSANKTEKSSRDDPDLKYFAIPLELKNRERWEAKHKPVLHIKAKYLPYRALRQQFWRAMLRQYDTDDNGYISKVEITTMLDSLGSTLHESTINGFFAKYPGKDSQGEPALSQDSAVRCLEELLDMFDQQRKARKANVVPPESKSSHSPSFRTSDSSVPSTPSLEPVVSGGSGTTVPIIHHEHHGTPVEEGETFDANDLAEEGGEEHVVEIRECPICHQPRMKKKSDADIITHIATCASQDWRQVNNIVMAGFVTASQAQRKWYSKVVTKIGYGGYKLGANSANILVQDRITGQINEERMSVYVRLGIRLLYKGLKSSKMETKRIRNMLRSMSIKQGRKYDDPASAAEIQSFINFHRLDMSEVLRPTEAFKNFNEFFYRELKPNARPCSAPDRPEIVTSPADCRSVVFNTLQEAQNIWVKGREFTVERLLGDAYAQDAKRYAGGSLGVFRLAPQDYHRFHIPVDGIMDEPKLIAGEYYTVNPMAIRSALDVYGENVRVVVPIDSVAHGRVMVICVGAMMVGSTVITRKSGEKVARAEELGYFKFGGSTLLLLFEPGQMEFDEDLVNNSSSALETLIRVGMSVGHSKGHDAYTPDMQKKDIEITTADKQDAQRRIEGSTGASGSLGLGAKLM